MTTPVRLFIGIDWADAKHDFHLITPQGDALLGQFKQTPAAIADTVEAWRKVSPGATIVVAIEATKGALINALLEYEDVVVYPINPAALAYYRKSHVHGGGKNDLLDAQRLVDYLRERIDKLRPLKRDSALTRELSALVQDRRGFVEQRVDLANQLTALLKQYFPAILELKPSKPYAEFFLNLVVAFPTLTDAQAAGVTKLRDHLHGLGMKRKADAHAKAIVAAKALCTDATTIRCFARRSVAIAEQLQTLSKHIKRYDAAIKLLLPTHPDHAVIASLPGAAAKTQARIIAALGDDRGRYQDAAALQAASGIAPITSQSGRSKFVNARWATTTFLRQTFHEYASVSIAASRWAKAFYDSQRKIGKSTHMAKRALAYKWQRIIFRCWQTGQPYDEARYIERLRLTGSPIYNLIAAAPKAGG